MKLRKALIYGVITLSLAVTMLIPMTGMVSAAAPQARAGMQVWFLDGEGHSVVPGANVMVKDASAVSGNTTVDSGTCRMWCTDEAAKVNVTFPASAQNQQFWVVYIETNSNWASKCSVDIGYADGGGGFTSFGTDQRVSIYFYHEVIKVELQLHSVTVPKDNYLAIKIINNDGTDHIVRNRGFSGVTSPRSDPGYPVPELATGVLFGVGVLGLLGYALASSRRPKASL